MRWTVSERPDRDDLFRVRDTDTDVDMYFPDFRSATRVAWLLNELCVKYYLPRGDEHTEEGNHGGNGHE